MSIKVYKDGTWLVQVQRNGVRRTERGEGGRPAAKQAEAVLIAELEAEARRDDAARILGVPRSSSPPTSIAVTPSPTLREFFDRRWLPHARVIENEQTQRTSRTPFNYLLYYLGDKRLDELLTAAAINAFTEAMKERGPISFTARRDGTPRARKCEALSNATINKSLQCLKALLNLAHREGVIPTAPLIDLLPTDDSEPVIPPTEEQYAAVLAACELFRPVAPLLPEVTDFAAETGARRAEVFTLSCRSVDLVRGTIRIEKQAKARLVNGQPWRPKHNKWREIPLSARARAILEARRAAGPWTPGDLVFPNKGGAPYDRMDRADGAEGKGYFADAVAAAGLKGVVTFHSLRHLFAVRLLTRGVPIAVVSDLLGHSDINLTVKQYGRFASDAKVKWDAVKVLDRPSDTPSL
jgi:integrase